MLETVGFAIELLFEPLANDGDSRTLANLLVTFRVCVALGVGVTFGQR